MDVEFIVNAQDGPDGDIAPPSLDGGHQELLRTDLDLALSGRITVGGIIGGRRGGLSVDDDGGAIIQDLNAPISCGLVFPRRRR